MPWEDVFARAFAEAGADPTKGFSEKQRAFDNDRHTRRKWLGTRRSGKTRGLAGHMLKNALPGETVPYCAPTIGVGRQILWPQFELMDKELGLGLHYDRAKHIVTTKSGGRVQIFGLSTMPEAEKLRGGRYPLAVVDECFVASTPIRAIGAVQRLISKPAPDILISIDGVVSTANHPYLTPEGWKRAEDIRPGDMLLVWEGFSSAGGDLPAGDVLGDLQVCLQREERAMHQAAADRCAQSASSLRDMRGGLHGAVPELQETDVFHQLPRCFTGEVEPRSIQASACFGSSEEERASTNARGMRHGPRSATPARAQAEAARRQRPWAYVAGVDASGCHWLDSSSCSADRRAKEGRGSQPFQIGSCRPISEALRGGGRAKPPVQDSKASGQPQGDVAHWQRVDRVEVHERGGVGRYDEVCPDGRVYNLTTESGLYFAGGRLVHNCGAVNSKILQYAVVECLSPATGDFIGMGGRGVVLAGTPSKLVDTWWHEQCKPGIAGEDPSFHFTTLYDNPFFAGREEQVIEQFLADNKLKRTDAAFIREMEGRFIIDTKALCYSADCIQTIPAVSLPTTGMTVMGLDFGFTHPSAWFVLRCVPPNVYVLETREVAGLDVHDIARVTHELRAKWKVGYMVGDSEGATIIATLNKRFGLPIQSATKTGRKLDRIWLMDSYLRSGTMYLGPDTEPFQEQLRSVGFNDDRTDHHEHQNDHLCDAGHYALELACAIGVADKPPPPEKWSPEWVEKEKAKMRAAAFAQAAQASRGRR